MRMLHIGSASAFQAEGVSSILIIRSQNIDLNNLYGDCCTETDVVGASYEGVQTDGDCSANPLGTTASKCYCGKSTIVTGTCLVSSVVEQSPCKR